VGYDVPDFVATKAPTDPGGKDPFIMRVDGKGGLFAALNEGPFPEHYEPVETPVEKNPFSSRMHNPVIKIWKTDAGKSIGDNWGKQKEFPIVATTYRVVEHWQAGGMSRWLEWLTECQPEMFVEMSKELAKEKGIQNGEQVKIRSARGEIQAVAIVTARFKPFQVEGKTVHQVGMPWHFGWGGLAKGAIANDLTPHVGDGNTTIPEYKAFLVDVKKA
jgi:formate dehydrogenase major subunit